MAKKNMINKPQAAEEQPADAGPAFEPPTSATKAPAVDPEPETQEETPVEGDEPSFQTVTIMLPVAPVPGHVYQSDHFEARLMTRPQRLAGKALCIGCDLAGLRLENGNRVISQADVIRYILEEIAAQLDGKDEG